MKNESYGQVIEAQSVAKGVGHRSEALAARLEAGSAALAAFAAAIVGKEHKPPIIDAFQENYPR